METLAWTAVAAVWFVCWRPGMVEWLSSLRVRKHDLEELRGINTVEDMFK